MFVVVIVVLGRGACFTTDLIYTRFKDCFCFLFVVCCFVVALCFTTDLIYTCFKDFFVFVCCFVVAVVLGRGACSFGLSLHGHGLLVLIILFF